jgi:hypothetical protein
MSSIASGLSKESNTPVITKTLPAQTNISKLPESANSLIIARDTKIAYLLNNWALQLELVSCLCWVAECSGSSQRELLNPLS